MTSKINSIQDFAYYIEELLLKPEFIFTEIEDRRGKHPTNYAMVKWNNPEQIITDKNFYIGRRYGDIFTKIFVNLDAEEFYRKFDIDAEGMQFRRTESEELSAINEFFDTNHIYYNADVFMYIYNIKPFPKGDRRPQEYQWKIYVLNISNIRDYSNRLENDEIVPLWLNTYTTSNSQYVRDASNNKFYKIPIEKITRMSFMNWETNPLEAIR